MRSSFAGENKRRPAGVPCRSGGRPDRGTAIAPLPDGSVLIAGHSNAPGAGGEDAFVARISAPGFAAAHPAFAGREIP